LIFLAVLVLAAVLILRQYFANRSAHIEMREDFILLHNKGHQKETVRLYQFLMQDLRRLPLPSLIDDFERTGGLVNTNKPDLENLVWKYHIGVRNELERRAEARVAEAIKRADSR
jgi:hypothetical protein